MTEERYFTLVLNGDAGVKNAQDLVAGLRDALGQHDTIGIDTRAVTAADVTTVQSLIAARKKADAAGKSLFLLAPLATPIERVLTTAGFCTPSDVADDFWTPADQPKGNWA